eukprot:m.13041 g.13041  ORF g.13041 m.13041 type:complete len:175 (-) comp9567_c0_seq1:114-638(-)
MGCGMSKDKAKPAKPRATRALSKGSLKTQPVTNAPRSIPNATRSVPGVTPETNTGSLEVPQNVPDVPRKSSTSSFSRFFARLDAKVETSDDMNDTNNNNVAGMVTSPKSSHNNTEQTIQEEQSPTPSQVEVQDDNATTPVPFSDAFSPEPTQPDVLSPFEEDRVNEARNMTIDA